ncbi:MAG: hypothetical protein KIT84_42985 [Labilithrix sp.]|nr:hypothetical protein [Labilithrix sp.]MCW5817845.1 hypothetical protein [Labilithrix sp.]
MNTETIKADVEKNIEKLAGLRDEVKVKLHLASLDAKQEWDDKIAPHVVNAEAAAKEITDASRAKLQEAIQKVEAFLGKLRD